MTSPVRVRGKIDAALDHPPQIAIGDDPRESTAGVDNGGDTELVGAHDVDRREQRGLLTHQRQVGTVVHEVGDAQPAGAQLAAGVQAGEILLAESPVLEQRHRQRVAESERGGRACRRGETEGTGLPGAPGEQHDGAGLRQAGIAEAGDGNHGGADLPQGRQQAQNLVGLAARRNGENHVSRSDDAQVSVGALRGMEKD